MQQAPVVVFMFKRMKHLVLIAFSLLPFTASSGVILQYHHVDDTTPSSTSIKVADFKRHLAYLKRHHFRVIPLDEFINTVQQGQVLSPDTVAITFDDGYSNVYSNAAPLLKEFGFPYTVFVNPAMIDDKNRSVMNWEQLRELSRQGALIANHSARHLHLHQRLAGETQTGWRERITADLLSSEKRITEETGQSLKYLAYPYGEFDRALQQWVRDYGFVGFGQHSGAVGPSNDFSRLPRFPASGRYSDLTTLATKLRSLPFHIASLDYADSLVSDPFPAVVIRFAEMDFNASQLACFTSSGERAKLTWTDANSVNVTSPSPLARGRSRYNCTAPSISRAGRFYWFSQPWLVQ